MRVGVSVRNSRSAKKEMNANIAIVAFLPSRNAAAKIATIDHHARTRALRLSITAALSSLARARSTRPISEATTSSATTPPISQ